MGVPRLLPLLTEIAATATFYVDGGSLLHLPEVVRALLARGHNVGLLGSGRAPWSSLSKDDRRRLLSDGRAVLAGYGIDQPSFRADQPLAPDDVELLVELAYPTSSSLAGQHSVGSGRMPVTVHPGGHVAVAVVAGATDAPSDSAAPSRVTPDRVASGGRVDDEWVRRWRGLVEWAKAAGVPLVLVARPSVVAGTDARFRDLEHFLRELATDPDVEFASIAEIARRTSPPPLHRRRRAVPWAGDPDVPVAPPSERDDADPTAWVDYLEARSLLPPGRHDVEVLTGGVSGRVVAVDDLVVKRAHRRLDVPSDWQAGTSRTLAEGRAMRIVSLGGGAVDLVPQVVHVDEANHVIVQRRVAGDPWKRRLLDGDVQQATVSAVLDAIATVHRAPVGDFDGLERFTALRLVPYLHRAAGVRPDLAASLHAVVAQLARRRDRLVHGDLSPKNILVGGDPSSVVLLDWEVAHRGDPAFDYGFLLVHLIAKSIHVTSSRAGLTAAIEEVVSRWDGDHEWLARLTGAVAVARCWGASRLEYLDEHERLALSDVGEQMLRAGEWDPSIRKGVVLR